MSKIVEKVVASRLNNHLFFNHLDEPLQSAHKPFHSCEAALFCVHNDVLQRAVYNHRCVVLLLLDLSAAFDTVDHSLLLSRLPSKLGNRGKALQWLEFVTFLLAPSSLPLILRNLSHVLITCGVPEGCISPSRSMLTLVLLAIWSTYKNA